MLTPDDPAFEQLCRELAARADALDASGAWPAEQLELCGRYGLTRWFVPPQWGGCELTEVELLRAYRRLGAACLSTAFVLTQPLGACRRIAAVDNEAVKARVLPAVGAGESLATVGISHLTTSRRHLAQPVMTARYDGATLVLDGLIPWVTGADHAQYIVTGATCDDGRQVLVVLPTDAPGVEVAATARLVGLSATHTGEVRLSGVRLGAEWLLAGPVENVLASIPSGAGTGSLSTSALALGVAAAATRYLSESADARPELAPAAEGLESELAELDADLLALADGTPVCSNDELRARANSLVLRAAQSALTAAKGSGYVVGHPAGRWCREALFFLVWSCPQPVAAAALCELAGLND